jgi:hypothetical protein
MLLRIIHLLSALACLLYCAVVAAGAVRERALSSVSRGRRRMDKWPTTLDQKDKEEQFKLVYDYIKFHLGMYIATPPVIALLAEPFGVKESTCFKVCLGLMVAVYIVSGAHAGLFMGRFINEPWDENILAEFDERAFTDRRRFMHHTLYWIGLGVGILGVILAVVFKWLGLEGGNHLVPPPAAGS